jgi:hypothetical protein
MKIILKIGIILASPYFFFLYWRNTMKEVGDIEARGELVWNQE